MSVTARGMGVALGTLLLSTAVAASTGQEAAAGKSRGIPQVEFVVVEFGGAEVVGFPLRSDPKLEQFLLINEDGALRVLPAEAARDATPAGKRSAAEVSSTTLVTGLAHEDRWVREHCQEVLETQREAAMPALKVGLVGKHVETRWRCLTVASRTPSRDLLRPVRANLGHKEPKVRQHALRALVRIDPEAGFDACCRAIDMDHDAKVRHEAVGQLGSLGNVRGVDHLVDQIHPENERGVRLQAFASLRRLTGQRFGRNEEHWRAWWTNHREEVLQEAEEKRARLREDEEDVEAQDPSAGGW